MWIQMQFGEDHVLIAVLTAISQSEEVVHERAGRSRSKMVTINIFFGIKMLHNFEFICKHVYMNT